MANRKGIVTNTDNNGWAEVVVQEGAGCGSCESGCGCAIGPTRSKLATRVLNKAGAKEGDMVAVHMNTPKMLISLAVLYLIPVAGLLAGALVGAEFGSTQTGDVAAMSVLSGVAGLGIGLLVMILLSRKIASTQGFTPVITRIVTFRETRADYAKAAS